MPSFFSAAPLRPPGRPSVETSANATPAGPSTVTTWLGKILTERRAFSNDYRDLNLLAQTAARRTMVTNLFAMFLPMLNEQ